METGVNQGQATRGVYYVRQGQAAQSGASRGWGRGGIHLLERTCTSPVDKPWLHSLLKQAIRPPHSNSTMHDALRVQLKADSDSVPLGLGPRFCISNKLPGAAAGLVAEYHCPGGSAWPTVSRGKER